MVPNETSLAVFILCTFNALPQVEPEADALQRGQTEWTGKAAETVPLIHQVSQQWKAHQRLLLLTEASTNNTPLIALEHLSSLIIKKKKAARTLIRQRSRRTLRLPSRLRGAAVRAFDHTYILSYIIVLFTIMHPTAGSSFFFFGALYCRASHANDRAAS